MSVETAARPERHSAYEDAIAIIVGTMFMALGVVIYTKAVLLAGSTAGLALLLQYASGIGFWWLFFAINLPFYVLAVRKLGWAFTLRTFAAVTLVSIFTRLTSELVSFSHLDPLYAAVMGGALSGTGLLILFRHRTGLGGINVLAIYLQDRFGIRAGYFQLAVDLAILAAAVFVIPLDRLALSVLGAVVVNMTLAINHRPGRYLGVT
ncbi:MULTISPECIES: YitT family protein [unclassified Shinella]|uniref:YitT family protein n=1 Tax=unclassified Shinella TaxID=2643062 RepID=UPI00225CE849|nr:MULTISPECIES: YitT family protein [unclassified Shinella]MCO5137268.1 YitT family protein [Shinella sp.]MDC7257556.1 YitT family protein [Shinella sp. YE25]CAI0340460.1 putative 5xTM membrane YitT family protein [Rhizobiaceae bacterium]CAK7258825.1 putative 5xTM membrane YitT family protein [Shinella sp. WSC3-e]